LTVVDEVAVEVPVEVVVDFEAAIEAVVEEAVSEEEIEEDAVEVSLILHFFDGTGNMTVIVPETRNRLHSTALRPHFLPLTQQFRIPIPSLAQLCHAQQSHDMLTMDPE
jgi:hypothetical protein